MIKFAVNGREAYSEQPGDTPLLWVVRDELGLTGTKFGCGVAQCGACTVHVNGAAGACLRHAGFGGRRQEGHHHRRALAGGGPSAAEGVDRRAGAAVRLLPVGPDHAGRGAAREEQEADARADRRAHERQHLPLRHVQPHRRAPSSAPRRRCSHDQSRTCSTSRSAAAPSSAAPPDSAFAFAPGASRKTAGRRRARPGRLNAYVSIAPDGTITIQSPVAEMGQGIMTGLPLIVAEELDADWSKVKVEQSPIDAAVSPSDLQGAIRRGEHLDARLLDAAARRRRAGAPRARRRRGREVGRARRRAAPPSRAPWCTAASGRKMSYGEIAAFADSRRPTPPAIDPAKDLKPPSQYRLIGKGVPRVDVPAKTNGSGAATASTRGCRAWRTRRSCARRCAAAARSRRTPHEREEAAGHRATS